MRIGPKTVATLALVLLTVAGCRSQDESNGSSKQAAVARPEFRNLGKRGASALDGGGAAISAIQR